PANMLPLPRYSGGEGWGEGANRCNGAGPSPPPLPPITGERGEDRPTVALFRSGQQLRSPSPPVREVEPRLERLQRLARGPGQEPPASDGRVHGKGGVVAVVVEQVEQLHAAAETLVLVARHQLEHVDGRGADAAVGYEVARAEVLVAQAGEEAVRRAYGRA